MCMDQGSDISAGLERRLSRLAEGPAGGVPGGVDAAVLRRAEGVLGRRRVAREWLPGWRGVAAAAVVGVVVGLGVWSVGGLGRKVDMVDALRAAKGGAAADEVRRIGAAAVSVKAGGGL